MVMANVFLEAENAIMIIQLSHLIKEKNVFTSRHVSINQIASFTIQRVRKMTGRQMSGRRQKFVDLLRVVLNV